MKSWNKTFAGPNLSILILLLGSLAVALPYWLDVHADPDLWWHTLTGNIILESGNIPSKDLYSFTASDNPWINHEWLTDIIFATAWRLNQDSGLLALRIIIFVLFCMFWSMGLWRRWKNELIVLTVMALSLPVVGLFMNVRPGSFTYFFVVLTLWIWDAWRTGKRKWIWIAPVLMLLWANMHGGFLFGLVMHATLFAAICLGFEDVEGDVTNRDKLLLGAAISCSFAATLVNPWGLDLYVYLYEELSAEHAFISEWQRLTGPQQVVFAAYGIIPLVLFGLSKNMNKISVPILFAISAYSAWSHGRFMILFVMFSGMLAMQAAGELYSRLPTSDRATSVFRRLSQPGHLIIFISIFAVYGAFQTMAIADNKREVFDLEAPVSMMPMGAICYLKQAQAGPNIAYYFNWNGSVLWHLFPRYRVAVDGRNATVYDANWVDAYIDSYRSGSLISHLAPHLVDVFLVKSDDPMDHTLSDNSEWTAAYRDQQAVVYLPLSGHQGKMATGRATPMGGTGVFPGACKID